MRTQKEIDYWVGKEVTVKYHDDNYIYKGIVSGYSENMHELILGFNEAQNGEEGWANTYYSEVIRHPRPMYFWIFKEDCELREV